MSIKEFCDKHNACREGRNWALANCSTMQEVWDKCPRPNWMIWIVTRPNVLDDKSLRLFAIWCCRQVQHLMKDPRSVAAIDAAEQFVNGLISGKELAEARQLAYNATVNTFDAAADAGLGVANASAAHAAADAAYAAAAAYAVAAYDATAAVAAYDAAHKEAQSKQMEYLRQNTKPNFK